MQARGKVADRSAANEILLAKSAPMALQKSNPQGRGSRLERDRLCSAGGDAGSMLLETLNPLNPGDPDLHQLPLSASP
jgi:hypothetical protein